MSKMNFIIFMSVLILSHGIGTADKRAGKCFENFRTQSWVVLKILKYFWTNKGEYPKDALRKIMQKCVDICIGLDPVYNDTCQAGCYQKVFSSDYFWAWMPKAFAKLQFILLRNTKDWNIRIFNQFRTIKDRRHILMKVFWWFHAFENCLILKYIGFAGFDQFKYFRIDFFKPRLSENILRKFLNGREFVPVVTGCPCHCTSHSVTQIGYCYFITL